MKKILVVDDQPTIRELVEATLRGEKYQIFQEASGEAAVETAKSEKPDLIILDVMMPDGMDGLETTRTIRSNETTKKSIIILLSAKGQDEDIEKGKKAGADDYFAKPFSPLDLINKVEEILGE